MSGAIEGHNWVLLLACLAAVISDVYFRKIYNWLTLSLGLLGFIHAFLMFGWGGIIQSFFGILAAFFLFSGLFWLRFLGGGDVKYLMALGAWGGLKFILEVGGLSVVLGGGLSLLMLIRAGRISAFLKSSYFFLLSIWVPELKLHYKPVAEDLKLPFALPISISVFLVIVGFGEILK